MSLIICIVVLACIGIGVFVISVYNNLVTLRNRFKNSFAQIDVQLKRRYDLIPNLVEVAKGYLKHEKETLEAVIQARNTASDARAAAAKNPTDARAILGLTGAETMLQGSMGKFFALMENYPDLKANQNMLQLSEELVSTENKISFARQAYNDAVMYFNNAIETFPSSIVAKTFNFNKAQSFTIENEEQRETVKVSF